MIVLATVCVKTAYVFVLPNFQVKNVNITNALRIALETDTVITENAFAIQDLPAKIAILRLVRMVAQEKENAEILFVNAMRVSPGLIVV